MGVWGLLCWEVMIVNKHGKQGSIGYTNWKVLAEGSLKISNSFIGLVHMPGAKLTLRELILDRIGGDGVNLRHGFVKIEYLKIRNNETWLSYRVFHPDCVQSYAVKPNGYELDPLGVIESVAIAHIDIEVTGEYSQILMLSDGGFKHWRVGYKSIYIRCDYPYWFSANTLEKSIIGNLEGKVDIAFNRKKGSPIIRIGDGIAGSPHCIKASPHSTSQVMLIGCGQNNIVPDNVIQV